MKKMIMLSVLLVAVITEAQIVEKNPVQIGQPAFGGTGCGPGSIALNFENNKLSVLFQNLSTRLAGSKQQIDRKNCSFRLPLQIENGYQVGVIALEVQGQVANNKGFTVSTDVSTGFVGLNKATASDTKLVNKNGLININRILTNQEMILSKCGSQNVMLELNSALRSVATKALAKNRVDARIQSTSIQLFLQKCL